MGIIGTISSLRDLIADYGDIRIAEVVRREKHVYNTSDSCGMLWRICARRNADLPKVQVRRKKELTKVSNYKNIPASLYH